MKALLPDNLLYLRALTYSSHYPNRPNQSFQSNPIPAHNRTPNRCRTSDGGETWPATKRKQKKKKRGGEYCVLRDGRIDIASTDRTSTLSCRPRTEPSPAMIVARLPRKKENGRTYGWKYNGREDEKKGRARSRQRRCERRCERPCHAFAVTPYCHPPTARASTIMWHGMAWRGRRWRLID